MKTTTLSMIVGIVGIVCMCAISQSQDVPRQTGETPVPPKENPATVYVPYKDIAAVLGPTGKTVLMDRTEFAKLLAAANANQAGQDAVELGQITQAQYRANAQAGNVAIEGELTVVSMSDKPIAVPMGFAQIGLTKFQLDDQPAPLGYDGQGRLCVVVTGKGKHRLAVQGSTTLRELEKGGMEFSVSLPAAVAGAMKLVAPGDLEVHSNAPLDAPVYDKSADKTTAEITLGGLSDLTVTLLGNGRAEGERAILLGESAEAVQLTADSQVLTCQYTVQVLRRGVRELRFTLPNNWTITDVNCPNMVKWSVEGFLKDLGPLTRKPADGGPQVHISIDGPPKIQILTVRLRSASRGTQQVSIKATAKFSGLKWTSPAVSLMNADYQRGYLLVDTGDDLKVKSEQLALARRENTDTTAGDKSNSQYGVLAAYQRFIAGTLITPGARLYYHWGNDWRIGLELAALESRVSSDERQTLRVSVDDVLLESRFQVTAVGKELFEIAMELPRGMQGDAGKMPAGHEEWSLQTVLVNGKPTGFEYRLADAAGKRVLTIELANPIPAEGVAEVAVVLRRAGVRKEQLWPTTRPAAGGALPFDTLAGPMVRLRANTTKGLYAVEPMGDIDVAAASAPKPLKEVTVGRMGALGLGWQTQLAWTYTAPTDPGDGSAAVALKVTGRLPRIAGDSVGLLSVQVGKLTADWRVTYVVTRAKTRTLYLLVDKSLGQNVTIEPLPPPQSRLPNQPPNQQQVSKPQVRLTAKTIVPFSDKTVPASSIVSDAMMSTPGFAARYNLWQLTLDGDTAGAIPLHVTYEVPLPESAGTDGFAAPLVRPIGRDQFTVREEMVAIQAGEELAVSLQSTAAAEVDAIELPLLPAPAHRLLWAVRLESPLTPKGAAASLTLKTTTHQGYATPPALVLSASYLTFVDAPQDGAGPFRTEATFRLVNSGLQFLDIRLPQDGQLWSIRVGDQQAKPKRGDGNQYLVSVPRQSQPIEVKVVYAGKASGSAEKLAIPAATLEGVRVNEVQWYLSPPPGYRMRDRRTKLADQTALEEVLDSFGSYALSGYRHEHRGQALSATPVPVEPYVVADEAPRVPNAEELGYQDRPTTRPAAPAGREGHDSGKPQTGRQPRAEPLDDSDSMVAGRYTLPVELIATPGAGPGVGFDGLTSPTLASGGAGLEVAMYSHTRSRTWWGVSFVLVALAGVRLIRKRSATRKAMFVIVIMLASTLLAFWTGAMGGGPGCIAFLNGAFYAALALVPVYLLVGIFRWISGNLQRRATPPAPPAPATVPTTPAGPSSTTVASILIAALTLFALASASLAGEPAQQQQQQERDQQEVAQAGREASVLRIPMNGEPPLVIPYDDPSRATEAAKILVPYAQFVRVWNLAHPDKPLAVPAPVSGAPVADVKYSVALVKNADRDAASQGKLDIQLTMQVVAPSPMPAKGIAIPMPLSGMAVASSTFNGKPASLQVGPGGMVLTVPSEAFAGKTVGELKVSAVATPKFNTDSIRSGRIDLGLPALPGAVMTFAGLDDDVVLEAYLGQKLAPWTLQKTSTAAGAQWTIPLGQTQDLSLRWTPKAAAGAADKTLSAYAAHDVYAFHWAVLAVSRINYTFSAGTNDRFGFLLPEGAEIRNLTGPNIRDHRIVGDKTQDGQKFKVVEVRLHRPATKSFELTLDWLGKLPELDKPQPLILPMATDVGRESGSVTLHSAGGMTLKVLDVQGGRKNSQDASLFSGQSAAEAASRVGQYTWPYRPFALTLQLFRTEAVREVKLDQLVRLDPQRVQLFVDATVAAKQGKVFDASFALPAGYELLSAVGPAVADWYVQTTPKGPQVHVSFRSGVDSTKFAMALLKEGTPANGMGILPMSATGVSPVSGGPGQRQDQKHGQDAHATFAVPLVTAIDSAGAAMKEQSGRLAVQLSASLEAQTFSVEKLKSTTPSAFRDWLGAEQSRAVQFAYWYEKPAISLSLKVRPLPTKIRVELLAALGVRTTAANYSYRLRYTIDGSPIDRVSFTMPTAYAPMAAVSCPSLRNVTTAAEGDRTRWTLTLVSEVTGTLDVSVNFSLPIDPSTTALPLPRIDTDAPNGYRAVVAVQNLSRHELSAAKSDGLSPMPAGEQASFLRREIVSSLQFVWESYSPNWAMDLKLTPAKVASRISKVVDLLALTTVIDRDGQARYEARISLQNRSEQFLRVRLPKELELWSAVVAGQGVKPVTDAKGPKDEVLIPLVKTSAGGLPYDVTLYLAGRASKPLGSVTTIQPPAIELVGIDVQRTTWSLRLPEGFKYETRGAGGNMSPIAGQAEKMTIELDAGLDQLKRYGEYNREAQSSFVGRNWDSMNDRITNQKAQAKQYIESNKGKLSGQEYSKLNAKLQEQDAVQLGLTENWKAEQRKNVLLDDNNINGYVGGTIVNGGVMTMQRDKAINDLPEFFNTANTGNIQAIKSELKSLQQIVKQERPTDEPVFESKPTDQTSAGELLAKGDKDLEEGKKPVKSGGGGKNAGGWRYEPDEKRKEAREGDYYKQSEVAQKKLADKQSQLADNRAQRALGPNSWGDSASGSVTSGARHATSQPAAPNSGPNRIATGYTGTWTLNQGDDRDSGRQIDQDDDYNQPGGPNGDLDGTLSTAGRRFHDPRAGDGNRGVGDLAVTIYTAGGSYSIPVQLPAGQVQLDFAHPAGGARVAVMAVSDSILHAVYGTIALVTIVLVLLVIRRIVRRVTRPRTA